MGTGALYACSNADQAWGVFNHFACKTLTSAGATWSRGLRSRGEVLEPRPVSQPLQSHVNPTAAREPVLLKLRRLVVERLGPCPALARICINPVDSSTKFVPLGMNLVSRQPSNVSFPRLAWISSFPSWMRNFRWTGSSALIGGKRLC